MKRAGGGRGKLRVMSYVPQLPTLTRFRRKSSYRRVVRKGAANEQRRGRDGRDGSSDAVPLFACPSFRRVPVPGVAALQGNGSRAIGLEHAIYLGEPRSEGGRKYPEGTRLKAVERIVNETRWGGEGGPDVCVPMHAMAAKLMSRKPSWLPLRVMVFLSPLPHDAPRGPEAQCASRKA